MLGKFIPLDGDQELTVNNVRVKFKQVLIISNSTFWMKHEKEIENWCNTSLTYFNITGMILSFNSSEDRTMFLLRWC